MDSSAMANEMDEKTSMDATGESHEDDQHSGQDTEPVSGASDTSSPGRTNQENGEEEPNPQDNKKESEVGGDTEGNGKKDGEKEIEMRAEMKESDEKEKAINTNEPENEKEVRENKENVVDQQKESSEAEEKCVKEDKSEEKEKIADSENMVPKAAEAEIKAKDKAKAEVKKASTGDKQEKTKGKAGTAPSSTVSRPSMQTSRQRSSRPSARREALAKFQQDTTPGVRNFKVQKTSAGISAGASIKQKILHWCSSRTRAYEGVSVENFSSSWSDGLAFCALVHRFFPSAFDFSSLKASEREKNFTLAFSMAESLAGCCPLLDVSDMVLMGNKPDPFSVFTYVQSLCQHLSKIEQERREQKKAEESKKSGEAENKVEGVEEAGDAAEQKMAEEQENVVEEEEREEEGNPDEEKGGAEEESSTQVGSDQATSQENTDPEAQT
ncbi:smoothelin-like 1 [Clarias gariepinus]|uniref:smoothelin-like 1 n=1 Tax=Clarias gariepinus TaxID=13013 RepID=UPI00234D94C8|nr:smoothelin-like 1 [Clarias gariepinus]